MHPLTNHIKSLLQSKAFAASCLESMENLFPPTPKPEIPPIKLAQQRMAINLPGVVALMAGLEYYCFVQQKKQVLLLEDLAAQKAPDDIMELFCRFANCAWKASQPFRGIERIERPIFIPFSLLPGDEVEKDKTQICTAAKLVQKLLPKNHHELDQEAWWKSFDRTIKNRVHLHHFAAGIEEAYYNGVGEAVPNALEYFDNETDAIYPEETVKTSIALAPFYALEAAIDYWLSKGENLSEKNVIDAAIDDPLSLYLLHAANLTGLLFTLPFHELRYPLVRFFGTPESLTDGYSKRLKVMGLLLEQNCRTTLHR